MADDSSFQIGLDFDTKQVESKLKDLQSKIQSMNKASGQMGGGAGNDFRERASLLLKKQYTDEINKQKTALQDMYGQFKKIDSALEGNLVKEGQINAKQKERLELLNKIHAQETMIGQVQKNNGGSGGSGGAGNAARRGRWDGAAGTAAGVGLVGEQLANTAEFMAARPYRRAGRQLDVSQGTQELRSRQINGDSFKDTMYAGERREAMGSMFDYYGIADKARYGRSLSKGLSRSAGTFLAGRKADDLYSGEDEDGNEMAAPGGSEGSWLKGKLAGLGASLTAGSIGLRDDETISGVSELFTPGFDPGEDPETALREMTGQDAMQKLKTFEMRNRMRDPNTYAQKEFFYNNRDKILDLQRSGGMNDEEMFGEDGFINRGGTEFNFDQRASMDQGIVGAGGGGAASQELMTNALQAQRGMGMTNANQTFGKLASYMGADESKEAFIKILATGMGQGLDNSKFVEEQKDYFSQVTALAQQVGGNESLTAAGIAAGMGDDNSRRGVQFGSGGYQNLMGLLNNTTGVAGAYNASLMDDDPLMKNIKGIDRISMQNMRFEDINEDSDKMKSYFEKGGGDKDDKEGFNDFVKRYRDNRRESLMGGYSNTDDGKEVMKAFDEVDSGAINLMPTDEKKKYLSTQAANFATFQGKTGLSEKEEMALFMSYAGQERKKKEADALKKKSDERKGIIESGKSGISELDNFVNPLGLGQPGEGVLAPTSERDNKIAGDYGGSDRAIEKGKKGEAGLQNETFANFATTVKGISEQMEKNIQMTSKDRIVMEEFNKAIAGGGEEMSKFLKSIKEINEKAEGSGGLLSWLGFGDDNNKSQDKVDGGD